MNYLVAYSPIGDLITMMICIIMLVALYESFVNRNYIFTVFLIGMLGTGFSALFNVAFYVSMNASNPNLALVLLFKILYRIGLCSILECYVVYIIKLIQIKSNHFFIYTTIINSVLCLADIVMLLMKVQSLENPLSIPLLISYFYSVGICLVLLVRFRSRTIPQIFNGLIFSAGYALIVFGVEMRHRNVSFLTITFLFPIFILMVLAHSNPYNMRTGALNLDSLNYYLRKNDHVTLACLKLYIDEDQVLPEELEIRLRNFWNGAFKNPKLFNPNHGSYILAIKEDDAAKKMETLFKELFIHEYINYRIDYKIIIFPKPSYCKSYSDVSDAFAFLGTKVHMNGFKIYEGDSIEVLNRRRDILEQIRDIDENQNLDDERVLVYFQPIRNNLTGKYDTAESLMRLNLPKIGLIYPDEFIGMIESNGYMHQFSMIMLNKVCQALKQLKDVERISVNFSISELKDPNFMEDFKMIAVMNGTDFSRVGVEFTENINTSDFDRVKEVVNQLQGLNTTVYLDDFGTGYSNFDRVLGLNMNVIKFDRSLLEIAAVDSNAHKVVSTFANTFSQMGFKILFEGVETGIQETICMESNADYMQGYKYSKPVELSKYIQFLSQEN